jgi:hypothetical protein
LEQNIDGLTEGKSKGKGKCKSKGKIHPIEVHEGPEEE